VTARRSAADLLLLCAGLVVWSSAFVWLYAALSLGCALGWEGVALGPLSLQRGVLIGLWAAHLAALAALLLWTRRHARTVPVEDRTGCFLARAAFHATVVALAATVINYAPVLALSPCL
jgi:hypothetical protein